MQRSKGRLRAKARKIRNSVLDSLALGRQHFRDFTGTYIFKRNASNIEPTNLKSAFRAGRVKRHPNSLKNLNPGSKPKE